MEATKQENIQDRIINIGRVVKVVKGGRRFSFNALVVSGDGMGNVGWGLGKANEVPEAIRKASYIAKKNMVRIPMTNGTLPHDVIVRFGAAKIFMRPAKEGAGIIAGGPVRAVLELAGVRDVVTKCHGSTNPHNVLKAIFAGLNELDTQEDVLLRRGMEIPEVKTEVSETTTAATATNDESSKSLEENNKGQETSS